LTVKFSGLQRVAGRVPPGDSKHRAGQAPSCAYTPLNGISSGLYDTALVNYYGTLVIHGYAAQSGRQIIRLSDAQRGFNLRGTGIVAVIDTGVDPNHPVLHPVLLTGATTSHAISRAPPSGSMYLPPA